MKRGKAILLSIGLLLVTLTTVGWALVRRHAADPYDFLQGHGVAHVGVIGPGSFEAKEIRSYTWRHPWQEVVKKARPELARLKMKEDISTQESDPRVYWQAGIIDGGICGTSADVSVSVQPGRALPLTFGGPVTDGDPEWVTVAVQTTLEDNWINVIRYTCFPIPDK